MAKQMLCNDYRVKLRGMAERFLREILNGKHGLESARVELAKIVKRRAEEEFPLKDMKVLAKYNQAHTAKNVHIVNLENRKVTEFELDQERLFPGDELYHHPKIGIDGEELDAYMSTIANIKNEFDTRIEDYKALIRESKSLEDVESVWPEASKLREAIGCLSKNLICLSEPVIERIKSDSQLTSKE